MAEAEVPAAAVEGFWLFEHLNEEPYGMLPLANLTAKGGPTGLKSYQRLASYNWYMEDNTSPTIVVPGCPKEFQFWNGGLLKNDRGVLMYDVNHLKIPAGPMDSLFLAMNKQAELSGKPPINFQKLFAFCSEGKEGLFRIDFERIGKTIIMTRVESSDFMQIDYESYDQALKQHLTKNHSKLGGGPFYQMASAQFGQFKMLLRFEADCADYTKLPGFKPGEEPTPEDGDKVSMALDAKTQCVKDGAHPLAFIPYGEAQKRHHLLTVTTCPQGAGFPFFTWAQLLFSGLDAVAVGWWKSNGDFARPAPYELHDINKLMKPLPYAVLSKVYDCLTKIINFMKQNEDDLKIALVWKGQEFVEIFQKSGDTPGAVSNPVKAMLQEQVKD